MKCQLNVVIDEKIGCSVFRKCCLHVLHVLYALDVVFVLSAYMVFLHCLFKLLLCLLCCMISVFDCICSLKIAKYVYQLRVVCIAPYIVCTFDIVTFVRIKSIFFMDLGILRHSGANCIHCMIRKICC